MTQARPVRAKAFEKPMFLHLQGAVFAIFFYLSNRNGRLFLFSNFQMNVSPKRLMKIIFM